MDTPTSTSLETTTTSILPTTAPTSIPPTTTPSTSILPKTAPTYIPPNIPFTYLHPTTLLTTSIPSSTRPTPTSPSPSAAASSPKLIGLVTAGCFIGTLTLTLLFFLYRRCTRRHCSHLPRTSISLPLSPTQQPIQPSPSITDTARGVPFFHDRPEDFQNPFHESNGSSEHSSVIGSEGGYQEPADVRRDRLARLMRRNHSPTPTLRASADGEGMSVWVITPQALNFDSKNSTSPAKLAPMGKSPSTPRSILKSPSSYTPRSILKTPPPPPILKRPSIPPPISTSVGYPTANANLTSSGNGHARTNGKPNPRPSLSARILSPIRATKLATPFRRNVKSFPDMAMQPLWVEMEMVPGTAAGARVGMNARPGTVAGGWVGGGVVGVGRDVEAAGWGVGGPGPGKWPIPTARPSRTWEWETAVEIGSEVAAATGVGIDGWASTTPVKTAWGIAVSGDGGSVGVGSTGNGSRGVGGKVKKGVKWGEDQVREFGRTPFASTVNSAAGSVVGDAGAVGEGEGEGEGNTDGEGDKSGDDDGEGDDDDGDEESDGNGQGKGVKNGLWDKELSGDDLGRDQRDWSPLRQRKF
ncbi:Transcription factor spt8 [Trapelia coarctata]|nr:Transcription factor spt8 [Trapelia coarctata]